MCIRPHLSYAHVFVIFLYGYRKISDPTAVALVQTYAFRNDAYTPDSIDTISGERYMNKTLRLADIVGPIMVGPSSSHTAGAVKIALMTRRLCGACKPTHVEFKLYGSFARTYRGHGTDRALCAGILGWQPDDLRIRTSLDYAKAHGVDVKFTPLPDEPYDHPNTVDVEVTDDAGNTFSTRGVSIGGGAAVLRRIGDVDVAITGENTSLVIAQRDVAGVLASISTVLSRNDVNIATTRMYRERRGEKAFTVMEIDSDVPQSVVDEISEQPNIISVRLIPSDRISNGGIPQEKSDSSSSRMTPPSAKEVDDVDFMNAHQMLAYCNDRHCTIAQAFRRREEVLCAQDGDVDHIDAYLDRVLDVMRHSVDNAFENETTAMGGLIGGEAQRVRSYHRDHAKSDPCDDQLTRLTSYALAVLETNASMGRIVACPTAGSAGVLPAVLLSLQDERDYDAHQMREALLCASAIGYIVSRNATVAGAEGGCQAEIGTASAMAAAAVVQLAGGTPEQCLAAASNALTNLMGLVCDPVAGLVEVPCQKRNATAAVSAMSSAQVALAGVANLVDFDQTVEAMYKVGLSLPFALRESALGGLAATPSACKWCEAHM